uniref:Concentrative nucleoside transporter C-terminal domain-containing protein n=1 Tax=Anas platyrhynchos platyrhynchos TaxID=8840 RepID=A0A493TS96_ANAPP
MPQGHPTTIPSLGITGSLSAGAMNLAVGLGGSHLLGRAHGDLPLNIRCPQLQIFLGYTKAGSVFVFGNTLVEEVFAFQSLPIIVFFSCVMSILYYLGAMQWLILKIDAASLIAASVMAAPCALAMSKLVYPEVEESKFKGKESVHIASGEEQNVLEAASSGAAASVGLVANIAANLIAFLAVLEFINAALLWFGEMVNIKDLSFQMICSYVLMPVAFLMGADWADSPVVAELLGIKIFLNEFVAYQQLATYKKNRLDGLEEWNGGQKQWISERAETITTFALCGFANISSIGIMLGGLTSLVPHRKSDFASIVLRALLTGICVSMLNSCLAGLMYVPTEVSDCVTFFGTANFTSTSYPIYTCCKQLFARWVCGRATGRVWSCRVLPGDPCAWGWQTGLGWDWLVELARM